VTLGEITRNADSIRPAVVDAAAPSCQPLSAELVLSCDDDPLGCAVSALRVSLWDADVRRAAALLVGGGTLIAMYFSASFSIGAWYTGSILLAFAVLGGTIVNDEHRADAHAA
jgi:hypothetical protein